VWGLVVYSLVAGNVILHYCARVYLPVWIIFVLCFGCAPAPCAAATPPLLPRPPPSVPSPLISPALGGTRLHAEARQPSCPRDGFKV